MPVSALGTKIAQLQNGVSTFILPLKRLDVHYCDWAGSSKGMLAFIKHTLPAFAKANPSVEIAISPRPRKHPVLRGHYLNGRQKAVCVKNMESNQILQKAELLRDSSGEKNKRVTTKKVTSISESVRGIWSPFHQTEEQRWKV